MEALRQGDIFDEIGAAIAGKELRVITRTCGCTT
jgi:hypothetical protein